MNKRLEYLGDQCDKRHRNMVAAFDAFQHALHTKCADIEETVTNLQSKWDEYTEGTTLEQQKGDDGEYFYSEYEVHINEMDDELNKMLAMKNALVVYQIARNDYKKSQDDLQKALLEEVRNNE